MNERRALLKTALYGFIFGAAALSAVAVIAWTGPTATPPGNNVTAPLNISTTNQSKGTSTNAPSGTNGYIGANGFCIGGSCVTSLLQPNEAFGGMYGIYAGSSCEPSNPLDGNACGCPLWAPYSVVLPTATEYNTFSGSYAVFYYCYYHS